MDIEAWLRGLGLEQYAEAFRDNAIDGEILPKLTADDLKDIGVTIVGHRRKMLEAIAVLGAGTGRHRRPRPRRPTRFRRLPRRHLPKPSAANSR